METTVVHLTEKDFDNIVLQSKLPVLVDFWAPWCGPCRMVGPVIDELANDFAGRVLVCKANVEDEKGLATRFHIMTIPSIFLFSEGKILKRSIGVKTKDEFIEMINETFELK